MTVDFIKLDKELLDSSFEYIDGELYRKSSNVRWDGIDVTDQNLVRVDDKRVPINRVLYYFQTGKLAEGEVMLNDSGVLVDVVDNNFRQVLVLKDTDKVVMK